jgi:hypothetical protein
MKQISNLIVFSQTSNLMDIAMIINQIDNQDLCLCLSTHKLFDIEKGTICNNVNKQVQFSCFADYLTDYEMEYCDIKAYELENQEDINSSELVDWYYDNIKRLKNQIILDNIRKGFNLAKKIIVANDLGIDLSIWEQNGFENCMKEDTKALTNQNSWVKYARIKSIWKRMKNVWYSEKNIHVIEDSEREYLFFGSLRRIKPRFKSELKINDYSVSFFCRVYRIILFLLLILKRKLNANFTIGYLFLSKEVNFLIRRDKQRYLASSLHEYIPALSDLAGNCRIQLVIFQDSYLPENYTSKYLKYFSNVNKFLTWDRFSLGIFKLHDLPAEVSSLFRPLILPEIIKVEYPIKTIVVATSGSGDWTALKNRSDEDLLVEAFVEVARQFPHINIIYRCHPLWAHPLHQGVNSIKRVDNYFRELGLKNIWVSSESLIQSEEFTGLSVKPESMAVDIERGDLFFGEHSIAMIDAALQGKMFASVNLTNRRDLFTIYSQIGFPHITRSEDLIKFIDRLSDSSEEIDLYNNAVSNYNNKVLS